MSSTNRGYDRHKTDYYVTPEEPVREFLSEFLQDIGEVRPDRLKWLDPCCGGDEKYAATYAKIIREEFDPVELRTMDIREDSHAEEKRDFLKAEFLPDEKPDIIVSNPPFFAAREFVEKGLEIVQYGGYVIFLLRLNFFGSKSRKDLFEKHMPVACYIHHKRIGFTDNGQTDSIEYAHFVWRKGDSPEFCKTKLL